MNNTTKNQILKGTENGLSFHTTDVLKFNRASHKNVNNIGWVMHGMQACKQCDQNTQND
jgi:hypothetical protein